MNHEGMKFVAKSQISTFSLLPNGKVQTLMPGLAMKAYAVRR